jgi:hypothetical protein
VVPYYGAGYPSGYEFVGGLPRGSEYGTGETVPADPGGSLRYMLVPASRRAPTSQDWHSELVLDGDWCKVPASARRSREHIVNIARLSGVALVDDPSSPTVSYAFQSGVKDITDAVDLAAHGPSARDVPTQLYLYAEPATVVGGGMTYGYPAVAAAGARFLSVASARNAGYSYDTFTLDGSLIPVATQVGLFPYIAPRAPDEDTGDGLALRHVTIDNLDPAIGFGSTSVSGFLKSGTLTVQDGALSWSLQLTPGDPT